MLCQMRQAESLHEGACGAHRVHIDVQLVVEVREGL